MDNGVYEGALTSPGIEDSGTPVCCHQLLDEQGLTEQMTFKLSLTLTVNILTVSEGSELWFTMPRTMPGCGDKDMS